MSNFNGHTTTHPPRRQNGRQLLWGTLFFVVLSVATLFGFVGWKAYDTGKRISEPLTISTSDPLEPEENPANLPPAPIVTEDAAPIRLTHTDGRINILLLGKASPPYAATHLTDTIMMASIDTTDGTVALLSIPRDLLVTLPQTRQRMKLNAVYNHGVESGTGIRPVVDTLYAITGQPIHYYAVVDFNAFIATIDALGGINVDVLRDVEDTRYPGPNYSYQTFTLEKGLQKMDGDTALKYVRYRHGDPEGDFGRAKRQQQVIQAVKNKVFSLQTLANPFRVSQLLDAVGDNVRTNITPAEVDDFFTLSQRVDTHNIATVVIDAWKPESLLRVAHVQTSGGRAFGLMPRAGTYGEIHELAEEVFDVQTLQRRREAIVAEEASIVLVNHSGNTQLPRRVTTLLDDLGMADVTQRRGQQKGQETIIIDRTNGSMPFTLDELVKKLPARSHGTTATDPTIAQRIQAIEAITEDVDIIVFLGTDLIEQHTYEQGTRADLEASPQE